MERLFVRLAEDAVQGPESDAPAGTLRAFPVSAALRGHVSNLLLYREALPDGQEVLERVLPDGALRLVFHLGTAPSAMALGASAAPALVRLRGRMEGLTVTLRPGAAAALLGVPAGELTGASVPLPDLWHGDAATLHQRLAGAADDATRVALLQQALLQRLQGARRGEPLAAAAWRLIAASGGQRALHEVAAAVGVGERRLQQLFRAEIGLTPRAAGRLARLHGLLRALRVQAAPDWADLAVERGFYDQAHLANEFRALCGLTPTQFLGRVVSASSKTA